jgi:glycosyltransferase involved in cell wall biosynthesis
MSAPATVTAFMPVYNGMKFLAESVGSILGQTLREFEFLVIDDGSSDGSAAYIEGLGDPRVRLIRHGANQGIRGTYNHGLAEARGTYVAIMDQDDVAAPARLERQLAFMEANPGVGLCGSQVSLIGDAGGPSWIRFLEPAEIRIALLFENPVCHPSVMLRMSTLTRHGLSYPDYPYAEEYALWTRLARHAALANLGEELLRYRVHAGQVSHRRSEAQAASMRRIAGEQLGALGVRPSGRDLIVHSLLGNAFVPVPGYMRLLRGWIWRLVAANESSGVYPQAAFVAQLTRRATEAESRTRVQLASMTPRRRIQWRVAGALQYLRAGGAQAAL